MGSRGETLQAGSQDGLERYVRTTLRYLRYVDPVAFPEEAITRLVEKYSEVMEAVQYPEVKAHVSYVRGARARVRDAV